MWLSINAFSKSVINRRTTSSRASLSSRRFFYFINKSSHRLASPLLLSAIHSASLCYSGRSRASRAYHGHARFACSLASALTTAHGRYQPFAGKSVITTLFVSAPRHSGGGFRIQKPRRSTRFFIGFDLCAHAVAAHVIVKLLAVLLFFLLDVVQRVARAGVVEFKDAGVVHG